MPAPAIDPACGLVIRPRTHTATPASDRLFGVLGTAVLHLGLMAVMVLGGGAALQSGQGQQADAALETRVQLRFVSAAELSGVQEAGLETPQPVRRQVPPASSTTPVTRALPRAVEKALEATVAVAAEQPSRSIEATATEMRAAPASPTEAARALAQQPTREASTGGGHGHGHGHHHGTGNRAAGPQGDAADTTQAVAGGGQAEADWARAVMRRLERFRSYPAAARQRRAEGVVLVQATIGADGRVLGTRLRTSCGNADLDAEALATVARARTLPVPPAHLVAPFQIDLPVAFALRS